MNNVFIKITPIKELKIQEIDELVKASSTEGYNFLNRLINDWSTGKNRFDKPNERLYQIKIDGKVVGIGGINNYPYSNDEKCGRIRRFYIHPNHRRKGIGRKLIKILLEDFKDHYNKVTLRTDKEEASKFYESIGFTRVNESQTHTHEMLIVV